LLTFRQSLLFDVQDTEPLGEQVAVTVQVVVGQAGQNEVTPSAVQDPLVPGQEELVAVQTLPEQGTVEPFQQLATQDDLGAMRGRLAASWGWGVTPRSDDAGAGAKIAARRASPVGSAEAARAGRAQKARASTVNPRSSLLLFISNPP